MRVNYPLNTTIKIYHLHYLIKIPRANKSQAGQDRLCIFRACLTTNARITTEDCRQMTKNSG